MKPATILTLILTSALIVLMIIWIAPAIGVGQNSACQRYPYTSGCR